MINSLQIENATAWELQQQLEFFQRDVEHAEKWLTEIKRVESILKVALCEKINGGHKFEEGKCKCGATCYAGVDMARVG